ncbi:response regulator [Cystobacter fuscus]
MSLVLIAEDEDAMLDIFAQIVEDMGHRALRAHNGEEALLLARTQPPDLVVSDHMMPRRTGMELLRELRADAVLREVPFLLLSAARPPGLEEATAFLAKPVDLDTFERAVRRCCACVPRTWNRRPGPARRTPAAPCARRCSTGWRMKSRRP